MTTRRFVETLGVLALTCCVPTRHEDALGSASFTVSSSPVSRDYAPAVAPAAGSGAGRGPISPTGASGTGATQPPFAAAGAGVAPPPVIGGAPGVAGASAAGSGGPAGTTGGGSAGRAAAGMTGGQAGSVGAAGGPPGAAQVGVLTLDFTTVNQRGRYAPQNVGAVWIETEAGMFVKTLERWGQIRANHLTRWNMASGGWGSFFGGGNTADQMDAVSRATLRSHGAHHVTWDMQDPTGKVVADGKYKVAIEVTEDNTRAGASADIAFDKGAAPQDITAPDKPPYSGLKLTYQP